MTDAEYWSIANSLPKRSDGSTWIVNWQSAIPNCGSPGLPQSCEWVLGFNPISGCWVDPGAQYVTRPNPYPSPSSWGVSLCNPPITQPPPSSGGGGGTTAPPSSGGGGSVGCASVGHVPLVGQPCCSGLIKDASGVCNQPSTGEVDTSVFSSIPTWVYVAGAGLLLFMFMKR